MKLMTTVQTVERLRQLFGDQLRVNEPLQRHTTARVGGTAELFLAVTTSEELLAAAEVAYNAGVSYFVLGGGSNILIADSGISGLVILNRARRVSFRHSGAGVVCTVESGANLSALARQCISKGLGGLEWAIGIPGTVGGAVVGNAGAHGADIDGQFLAATIWEPGRGVFVYNREDMKYGYRDSVLKRKERQPGGASTGSMFKNPENYYAGYLIDTAGLKGFRVGDAAISEKHANFFINEGDATAEDVRSLIAEAWNAVREQFGIEMELEVELVGDWKFES